MNIKGASKEANEWLNATFGQESVLNLFGKIALSPFLVGVAVVIFIIGAIFIKSDEAV